MALSANANTTWIEEGIRVSLPVAASAHIYRGGWVGKDPAGNIKPFVPGDELVGMAYEEADNSSGAASAINCRVTIDGDLLFALTSADNAWIGQPLYATADDAIALTGHPDAYVGTFLQAEDTNVARLVLRPPGAEPPNGAGSICITLTGHEDFTATLSSATSYMNNGFTLKSCLGTGIAQNDAENAGIKMAFDAVAEVALCSVRTPNDCLPVDKGITFDVELCVSDIGDNAALDIDWGLGTALTTNSEADIDHANMAQLACFHLDGNSDNISAQSDNATTDVAAVDTTIDNDSSTDVAKRFKIIVRPTGSVEFWIDGARVLSTTTFAVLSTTVLAAFVNMEKTSDNTTAEVIFRNLVVKGGHSARVG